VTCCAVALVCRLLFLLDGDTIWCDGERIRLMDFDSPETYRARCESERIAGYDAKARLWPSLREPL
jgi:endonuclease YncB( thermonuclease family)